MVQESDMQREYDELTMMVHLQAHGRMKPNLAYTAPQGDAPALKFDEGSIAIYRQPYDPYRLPNLISQLARSGERELAQEYLVKYQSQIRADTKRDVEWLNGDTCNASISNFS
jgi:hypothetical protein